MKTKFVTTDCGAVVPEKIAKDVDGLQGSFRRKALVQQSNELEPGSQTEISLVSVESVDRDGDVVIAKGVDRNLFMQSRVVLWQHNMELPAIGKCEWIKPQGNGLLAKTQYAKRPEDYAGEYFPELIWSLVQQGVVTGKSIGFLALSQREATPGEIAIHPEWKAANVIEESVLVEYSVCNLGVNPDALVQEVSKGFKASDDFFKTLGVCLPVRAKVNLEEIIASQVIVKKKKRINKDKLFLKALEQMELDADRIAQIALETYQARRGV